MPDAEAPRIRLQTRPVEAVNPALIAGATIYAIAFALRLLPVFVFPGINFPDEIFQTVEQAHRVVYGTGLVPWEFLYGTRSWVLPGFIAGIMQAVRFAGDGPAVYLPVIGTVFAALGAGSALCAFLWGRRLYGLWGGIIAGALTACWVDAVYFGPRTLSEVVSAHVLVIGLYLAAPGYAVQARRRLVIAGFLLGVAALLRIQIAPAVAFVVLWPWRNAAPLPLRIRPLIAGGVAALVLFGAVDAATWGWPLESLWRNVEINLFDGVSTYFGVMPGYAYAEFVLYYWGAVVIAILVLARLGALRLPQLAVLALIVVVLHSAVGHKEFRFIYPALLLTIISAGLGLAQIVDWIADGFALRGMSTAIALRTAAVPVLLLAALTPAVLAFTPPYLELWRRGADAVRADAIVAKLPNVCGVDLYGVPWFLSGGYSMIHQNAPLYWISDQAGFLAHRDAFNTVLASHALPENSGFTTLRCVHDVCVAQRPGSCSALPMAPSEKPAGLEKIAPLTR